MGIFKRLFKMGEAKTNAVIDDMENPIEMTEQGIRDLKVDLEKSIKALAEVKAMAIRSKNEAETNRNQAVEYENKAMLLLKRAEQGAVAPEEADRLATLALQKKEECLKNLQVAETNQKKYEESVKKLEGNVSTLKATISKWENEAKILKARSKVAEATQNVNKQMASLDSSSTLSMLNRMKEKVEQQEALSESYGELAIENKSADDEIESALDNTNTQSDALAALKAKMKNKELGTGNPPPPQI